MNKKRKIIRIMIAVVIIAAAAAGAAYYFLLPDEVSAEAAKRADISQKISETGTVISDDPVTIYAPVAGRIQSVNYAVNDIVPAGAGLITYDLTTFEDTIADLSLNVDYHEDGYNAAVADNAKNKKAAGEAGSGADALKQQYIETEAILNQIETDQAGKNQYVQSTIQGIEGAIGNMNTELEILKNKENASQDEINRLKDRISASRDAMATLPVNGMTVEETAKYKELKMQLELIDKEWTQNLSKKTAAEEKIVTQEHIDQLSDSLEIAQLALDKAARNLEKAKAGVSFNAEASVLSRMVDSGAHVEEGSALMILQPLSGYRVSVKISRYDIDSIEAGQKAEITVGSNTYSGHVEKIVPVAVSDTTGKPKVRVDVAFDGPAGTPAIGIEAGVVIYVSSKEDVLSVPDSAVYYGDEGDYLYLVKDGKLEKRIVTAGITGGGRTEIEEGLSEGELVVTSPVSDDEIGSRVSVSASK